MHRFPQPPVVRGLMLVTMLAATAMNAFGQFGRLKGTWINAAMDAIVISDTATNSEENYLSTGDVDDSFLLRCYGDTLSFQNRYTSSATNFKQLYTDRYDLKVIYSDSLTLVVEPVSKPAIDFFGGRRRITVKRQEYAIDSTIRSEKVAFRSGECYGTCPTYHLEIDSTKAFRLHVETAYKSGRSFQHDSTATGYFVGQLPDTLYNQLVHALQSCYLRQLMVEPKLCCDAPLQTVSIYFNKQKKSFETMFPPIIVRKLLTVLHDIYVRSPRKRTSRPFTLEH